LIIATGDEPFGAAERHVMQHSTSAAAVTIHGARLHRLHLVELISIKAFWYPDATETELLALYCTDKLRLSFDVAV
jgi:hypothetical protein